MCACATLSSFNSLVGEPDHWKHHRDCEGCLPIRLVQKGATPLHVVCGVKLFYWTGWPDLRISAVFPGGKCSTQDEEESKYLCEWTKVGNLVCFSRVLFSEIYNSHKVCYRTVGVEGGLGKPPGCRALGGASRIHGEGVAPDGIRSHDGEERARRSYLLRKPM